LEYESRDKNSWDITPLSANILFYIPHSKLRAMDYKAPEHHAKIKLQRNLNNAGYSVVNILF
jgi:hypothetical protein